MVGGEGGGGLGYFVILKGSFSRVTNIECHIFNPILEKLNRSMSELNDIYTLHQLFVRPFKIKMNEHGSKNTK